MEKIRGVTRFYPCYTPEGITWRGPSPLHCLVPVVLRKWPRKPWAIQPLPSFCCGLLLRSPLLPVREEFSLPSFQYWFPKRMRKSGLLDGSSQSLRPSKKPFLLSGLPFLLLLLAFLYSLCPLSWELVTNKTIQYAISDFQKLDFFYIAPMFWFSATIPGLAEKKEQVLSHPLSVR